MASPSAPEVPALLRRFMGDPTLAAALRRFWRQAYEGNPGLRHDPSRRRVLIADCLWELKNMEAPR